MESTFFKKKQHPCLSCGACCAYYRVSFYWREANKEDNPKPVPEQFVEILNPTYSCMKGTNRPSPRCDCLEGELGTKVSCSIYDLRPSPCREFTPSFEAGLPNQFCDKARAQIGLPPLSLADY